MLRRNLNHDSNGSTPSAVAPITYEVCFDLEPRPLNTLAAGQVAVVEDVTGDSDDMAKLKAMGVCTGRRLQLVKGGDPLVVRVLGSRLGISGRLAEHVAVRPCRASAPSPFDADSKSAAPRPSVEK